MISDFTKNIFQVDEYFELVELGQDRTIENKTVFIATDDPSVLTELRSMYPHYIFLGNKAASKLASKRDQARLSRAGLFGIIEDIHILSLSDHLVCTMSSNVCRLAYELQQNRLNRGERNVDSLGIFHNKPKPKFQVFAFHIDFQPPFSK